MTLRSLPLNATRTPLSDGCRPSPASMTPAFTSSSLKSVISVSSRSLGISPRSDCSFALISTMTRISRSSLVDLAFHHVRRANTAEIDTAARKSV